MRNIVPPPGWPSRDPDGADNPKELTSRTGSSLRVRILLLVVAVVTPLAGVSFFIIGSFQKPLLECYVMMEHISAANDLSHLERLVIDKDLYDAIGDISHAGKRQQLVARLSGIQYTSSSLLSASMCNSRMRPTV
jgi:hypothetical protein